MYDNRLTSRLTDYWNRLRKDSPVPKWESFNAPAMEDIWKQCCKWSVDPAQNDNFIYTYQYVGESVKEALGADPTGKVFTGQFQHLPGARLVKRMDECVKTQTLIFDEGQFPNEKHKIVKYRSCMLPFGIKEGKITHVVLGLSWRAF